MKTYTLYYSDIIGRLVFGKVINYSVFTSTKSYHSWNAIESYAIKTGPTKYNFQIELPENGLYLLTHLRTRCTKGTVTNFELCDDMYTNGETLIGKITSIRCDTIKNNKQHLVFLEIIEAGG